MKKYLTLLAGALLFVFLISCNLSKLFQKEEACAITCDASAVPAQGTAPLSVVFMASSTVTGCTSTASYSWDFGDQGFSTTQNTSHIYQSAGTYLWTMTATAGGVQCTKSGAVTVKSGSYYPPTDRPTSGSGTAGLGVKLVTNLRTGVFRVKVNDELKAEESFHNEAKGKNLLKLKKFFPKPAVVL